MSADLDTDAEFKVDKRIHGWARAAAKIMDVLDTYQWSSHEAKIKACDDCLQAAQDIVEKATNEPL